ncbi:MAG: glycosyltransferase [Balneolaceae bacterium]
MITAIIPTYNNQKYINGAINSIVGQTVKPDSLIVIDDGSTDNTFEILSSLGKVSGDTISGSVNGVNIYIVRTKNRGVSAARNLGIKMASGSEIICFLDGDDWYEPTKIEKSLVELKKDPYVAMVYSDFYTYYESIDVRVREFKRPFDYQKLILDNHVNSNSVFKTVIFQEVGLFNESLTMSEDYDMWLRIAHVSDIFHIPEALFTYRITGSNTTSRHTINEILEANNIVQGAAMERYKNG